MIRYVIRRAMLRYRRFLEERTHEMHRQEKKVLMDIVSAQQDQLFEAEDNLDRLKEAVKGVVSNTEQDPMSRLWQIEGLVSRA